MPTKNERKARQGTASRKSNSFSLVKEDIESLMRDNFDNSLKDIGSFKGTILSIETKLLVENKSGKETSTIKDGNQPANFYEILIRPEWFKSPAPWTFEDFTVEDDVINFGKNSAAARDAHPMARSNDVLGKGQTVLLKIGQIVICTFGDGVDNQGRFRDIRFDLNSTGRMDEEMQITLERRGSSAAFNKGSAGLLGGSNTPTSASDQNLTDVTSSKSENPIYDSKSPKSSELLKDEADTNMAKTLDKYRQMQEIMGIKLTINDALVKKGSSRENQRTGSLHFTGKAIDVSIRGMTNKQKLQLADAASTVGFTSFGWGTGILHMDWRSRNASWDYKQPKYGGVKVSELKEWAKAGGIKTKGSLVAKYPNV
ncbi:MAG: hypothetical protein ACXADW_22900 [Candidatus Hodarchaeales archaeon]|jgi:hypothetical protein